MDTTDPAAARVRLALAATGLGLTALCAVLLAADVDSPLRIVAALGFVLLVPGWAVVGLLGLEDPTANLTLSITTSLVLGILVAQLLVWQESYGVGTTFALLAALSVVGLGVQVAGSMRTVATSTGDGS